MVAPLSIAILITASLDWTSTTLEALPEDRNSFNPRANATATMSSQSAKLTISFVRVYLYVAVILTKNSPYKQGLRSLVRFHLANKLLFTLSILTRPAYHSPFGDHYSAAYTDIIHNILSLSFKIYNHTNRVTAATNSYILCS